MNTQKTTRIFSINILINYIFIVLIASLLVILPYSLKFEIGDSKWIEKIIPFILLLLLIIIIYKFIAFIYRLVKKIQPIRGNKKRYLILFCIVFIINIVAVFIDSNSQISKSKQALNYIELYIMSNEEDSQDIDNKVDKYMLDYQKTNLFKNDLFNFTIQETDMYLNKKATNQNVLKDKLNPILMMLHTIYPDKKESSYAYDKMNDESLEDIDADEKTKNNDMSENSTSNEGVQQDTKTTNNSSEVFKKIGALLPILLVLSPFIIFHVVVANLISRDAEKRNMNSSNWWVATFFLGLFAIIMYVVVRDPRKDI